MYLSHFQLREHPFQITPDSDFLYMSEAHARAKAYMDYTLRNKDGFVVITGEVGAGKTTLIRKLLSEFDDRIVVAKIFQTQLNEVEFLQAVLVEFGLSPFKANKVELMDMLASFLIEMFHKNKQLVLIVDEAQNLSARVLEEIRLLSGLETQKQKILHVILVGQPELNDTLDAPELEQLLQRVRLRFHIGALSANETHDYIAHRLRIAGAKRSLFARDALALVYDYAGGIPRLINTLCDTALMCAYADDDRTVDRATVQAAVGELGWKPFSERTRTLALTERRPHLRLASHVERLPLIDNAPARQWEQMSASLDAMAQRLDTIERMLAQVAEQRSEQRKMRKISVRLGRAQLMQLVKHLSVEMEKNHIAPGG